MKKVFLIFSMLLFLSGCGGSVQETCEVFLSQITNGSDLNNLETFWGCDSNIEGFSRFSFAISDSGDGISDRIGGFTWEETGCGNGALTTSEGQIQLRNLDGSGAVITFNLSGAGIGGTASSSCTLFELIDPDRDEDGVFQDGDFSGVEGDEPCNPAFQQIGCDDNCPDTPNPKQEDKDSDGIGDACDPTNDLDPDGDGINNFDDNCPDDFNPNQENNDGDFLGNVCDDDLDGDTIPQDGDFSGVEGDNPCTGGNDFQCDDNCPNIANSNQADQDNNGIGDVCDN